jgi:hypothetical protein
METSVEHYASGETSRRNAIITQSYDRFITTSKSNSSVFYTVSVI